MKVQKIPSKTALFVIDVEEKFLTPTTRKVLPHIEKVIKEGGYKVVVVGEYTDRSTNINIASKKAWHTSEKPLPKHERTIESIRSLLDPKRTLTIVKTTRSLFGTNTNTLAAYLRRRGIEEVHIVGLETHDCVLATTLDSFDHGFTTLVIENACASKKNKDHEAALQILRTLHLSRKII